MRWDFWDKYANKTDIKTPVDSSFLCWQAPLPWGGFPAGSKQKPCYSAPPSFPRCASHSVVITSCARGHLTLQMRFCKLVAKFFFSSRLHVFSLDFFSVAVYYADIPFHAGLAGGHGFHLPARLHVLQSVDHLPKHDLSRGSQSLLGPSSVW